MVEIWVGDGSLGPARVPGGQLDDGPLDTVFTREVAPWPPVAAAYWVYAAVGLYPSRTQTPPHVAGAVARVLRISLATESRDRGSRA